MYELHGWLRRIGYTPYMSGIGMNIDCPTATSKKLARTVERAYVETGQRVRIVGHSLGGMIGRRVSLESPHQVSQLVYMGTPIQGVNTHPAMIAAATMLANARGLVSGGDQCFASGCACDFLEDARRPLSAEVRHDAIFTRADGVVDWHDSCETEVRRNHEVGGTHIGLVYNPRAYKALGHILRNRRAA
jgi:pimeloyl-ACP methyl ester carboxylesterase